MCIIKETGYEFSKIIVTHRIRLQIFHKIERVLKKEVNDKKLFCVQADHWS